MSVQVLVESIVTESEDAVVLSELIEPVKDEESEIVISSLEIASTEISPASACFERLNVHMPPFAPAVPHPLELSFPDTVRRFVPSARVRETDDYFEMLRRSLVGKCNVMRTYPYAMEFALRVYYEKDPDVADEIQYDFEQVNRQTEKKVLDRIDKSLFRDGIDFSMMYQEMVWTADGYMRNAMMQDRINPDLLEEDFEKLICFWRSIYLR